MNNYLYLYQQLETIRKKLWYLLLNWPVNYKEICAKNLSVEIKIKTGVPFRELIQAVKDSGVDLVVIGRKGRTNLAGILFGTTAEKMFRHCPVSLLSLRRDEDMDRSFI